MAEDLNIILTTQIDRSQQAIKNINTQIDELEKKIKSINIDIKINDAAINTLNKFAAAVDSANKYVAEGNKIIRQEEEIFKRLDGVIEKTTRQYLKNGEIIEKTRKITQEKIESIKQEEIAVDKLTSQYGELIKVVKLQNANKEETGKALTFRNNQGIETTAFYRAGEESAFKIVDNVEKIKNAEIKAQQQINNAIAQTETNRRTELEKSAQAQAKYINKALEDTYKLQKAEELRIRNLGDPKSNVRIDKNVFKESADETRKGLEQYIKSAYGTNVEIQKLQRNVNAAGKEIWSFTANVQNGKTKFDQYRGSIDKTTNALYQQSKTLQTNHARQLNMFEQFKVAASRIPIWMAGMTAFYFPLRQFQLGLENIKELDKAFTDLRKVSDESKDSLKDFLLEANKIGSVLGRTSIEVTKSVAEFSRLGFNLKEATILAKEALLYANIGNIDVETSSQSIISTIKGFGIAVDEEGKNVRKVVDLFNEIGNNFAISSAGIGEALRRSAASLYTSGNTIEQSVAMLTAANSVIQDPGVVGTSMKTVAMRLRGISDEGENIANLVPQLESAFQRLGLTLRKDDETFKSTFEIFDDLAKVWSTLSDFDQANILELVAGKRQGNVIAAMLGNWQDSLSALDTGLNSAGSAMVEFGKFTDSVEFKSKRLQNTLIGFWQTNLNTEGFKEFIDLGTAFISTFTKMTSILGLVPVVVGTASGAIAVFNTNIRNLVASSFIGNWAQSLTLYVTTLATKFGILSTSITAARIAMTLFQGVATFGIATALTFILTNLTAEFAKNADVLKQDTDVMLANITATKDSINKIDQLIVKLKNSNLSLEDQKNIQKQIAQILPSSTTGYNNQNEALAENLGLVEKLNTAKKEELQNKAFEILANVGSTAQMEENIKRIQELEDLKQKTISDLNNPSWTFAPEDSWFFKEINKFDKELSTLKNVVDQYNIAANQINQSNILEEKLKTFSYGLSEVIKKLDDSSTAANKNKSTLTNLSELQNKLLLSYKETSDKISDLNSLIYDYNEGKEITAERILEVMQKEQGLINAFTVENGQIQLNIEAVETLRDSKTSAFDLLVKQQEAEVENEKKATLEKLTQYGIQIDGLKSIAEARNALIKQEEAMMETGTLDYKTAGAMVGAQYRLLELESFQSRISKLKETAKSGFKTVGIKEDEKDKKEIEPFESDRVQSIEDLNHALEKSDLNLSKLKDTSAEYRAELNNQVTIKGDLQKAYMKESQSLAEKNIELQKELDALPAWGKMTDEQKEKYNDLSKQVEDNKQQIDDYYSSWLDAEKSIVSANKNIADSIKSQFDEAKKQFEEFKNELKGFADVFSDIAEAIYDEQTKQEKKRHDDAMDNLDAELKRFKDNVDAKLKGLDREKDLEEYNTKLTKLQKEEQEIQNKISIASLDKSAEGKTALFELQKDLAKKEEEIAELQKDRDYELKKQGYQDDLDLFEENNKKKKEIEDALNKAKLDQIEQNRIEDENTQEEIENGNFEGIESKLSTFAQYVQDNMDLIGQAIGTNLLDKIDAAIDKLDIMNNIQFDVLISSLQALKSEFESAGETQATSYIDEVLSVIKDRKFEMTEEVAKILANVDLIIQILQNKLKYATLATPEERQTLTNQTDLLRAQLATNLGVDLADVESWIGSNVSLSNAVQNITELIASGGGNPPTTAPPPTGTPPSTPTPTPPPPERKETTEESRARLEAGLSMAIARGDTELANSLQNQLDKLHDGGIVGGKGTRLTEIINKMVNLKPGETMVKSLIGELQIPPKNIPNLAAAIGGGSSVNNVYNLSLKFDNFRGTKDEQRQIWDSVVSGLKKMGK